jgi:hypothetical protein
VVLEIPFWSPIYFLVSSFNHSKPQPPPLHSRLLKRRAHELNNQTVALDPPSSIFISHSFCPFLIFRWIKHPNSSPGAPLSIFMAFADVLHGDKSHRSSWKHWYTELTYTCPQCIIRSGTQNLLVTEISLNKRETYQIIQSNY